MYDPALTGQGGHGGLRHAGEGQTSETQESPQARSMPGVGGSSNITSGAGAGGGGGPSSHNAGRGAASTSMAPSTSTSASLAPGNKPQNSPTVFNAVYSNVPVYEMMVRGIGVMRRRSDSWINATQILKVAGIEKGRRTKILEKDIAAEGSGIPFEKVQGGYGRYQGTWIPFHCAAELADQYAVRALIQPLLDFQAAPPPPPLAGLAGTPGAGSPTVKTVPLNNNSNNQQPPGQQALSSSSTSSTLNHHQQAGTANPQAQRSAQQAQLAQAQQLPLPTASTSKANGLASHPPSEREPATPSRKKRPRQSRVSSSAGKEPEEGADGAEVEEGSNAAATPAAASPTKKRARRETAQSKAAAAAAAAAAVEARIPEEDEEEMDEQLQGASMEDDQQEGDADMITEPPKPGSSSSAAAAGGGGATTTAVRHQNRHSILRIRPATKYPLNLPLNIEHRNLLMSLFLADDSSASPTSSTADPDPSGLVESFPRDTDANTPIDDQQHTALHWAAALARLSTVRALIATLGADPCRGNLNGETPLMRAVLVTNNFDTETFTTTTTATATPAAPARSSPAGTQDESSLLDLLAPSIMAVDDNSRTVLHHIALVAGIKGRSASARHYIESILHYLLLAQQQRRRRQTGAQDGDDAVDNPTLDDDDEEEEEENSLAEFVNARDANGDTALNIAARVGSRPIVKILLDYGADQRIPNNLGLRPGDFGLVEQGLRPATEAERALDNFARSSSSTLQKPAARSSAPGEPPLTHQQLSSQILSSFTDLLSTLSTEFAAELAGRSESLDRTRQQLHLATKDLAEQRQAIATLREDVKAVELTKWRIRNLEKALLDEDKFDWTGRSAPDGSPAFPPGGPAQSTPVDLQLDELDEEVIRKAFEFRGVGSTLGTLQAVNIPKDIAADPRDPAEPAGSTNSSGDDDGGKASLTSTSTTPPPTRLTLAQLRRMVLWYQRVLRLLRDRIARVKGNSGEMELDARKVVKLCTGLETDAEVEEVVPNLIVALESDTGDGAAFDLQRIANFMAKVRSQEVDPSNQPDEA